MRNIARFPYVGFLLANVSFLSKRVFSPFKEALLSDAALDSFDPESYFEDSEVKNKLSGQIQPIKEAIPEIQGQIVLEGESGLGKTMFIRHLLIDSKGIVVYLPAEKCSNGVIEAIQAKLQGIAKDLDFLSNLIYTRAIDICIDGLNEVTPDTQTKITDFVQSYRKANVIIATQPIGWVPPSSVRVYEMHPLRASQIEHFLLTRKPILHKDGSLSEMEYERACSTYLAEVLNEQRPKADLDMARRILSNPMDLTVVGQMLAHGQNPDLFRLQEQQYKIMAAEYKQVNLNPFPIDRFSERVYQMKVNDESALPKEDFLSEQDCMEQYKLILSRYSVDAHGNSVRMRRFRHDKIMDFFIVQTFLGVSNDRPQKHMDESRFRGVYLLLVFLLPEDEANKLALYLATYAADTKDRMISEPFLLLLASRKTE